MSLWNIAANLRLLRGTGWNGQGGTHPSKKRRNHDKMIMSKDSDIIGSATHGRVCDHQSDWEEANGYAQKKMTFQQDRGLLAGHWRPLPALAAHRTVSGRGALGPLCGSEAVI